MWFRTSGQANQTKQSTKLSKHCLTFHLRYCFCFAPPFKLLSHNHQHPKELPSCSSFLHTRTQHPKHHHHATTTRTPSQVKERREKKSRTKEDYLQTHSSGSFFPRDKERYLRCPTGYIVTHARYPNTELEALTEGGHEMHGKTHETFLFLAHEARTSAAGKSSRNFDGCLGSGARRIFTQVCRNISRNVCSIT